MTLYLDSVITFGKYKGKKLCNIPTQYVKWLKENTDHVVKHKMKPKIEKVKLNDTKLTIYDFIRMENLHRITCARIGRKLIYDNVQIPF